MVENSSLCILTLPRYSVRITINALKHGSLVLIEYSARHEVAIVLAHPALGAGFLRWYQQHCITVSDMADCTWYVVIVNMLQR